MQQFLIELTHINVVGPLVIILCLMIFLGTTIFFFLGLSGRVVLGGDFQIHAKIMDLLMKVLAVEIIASCTLYFGTYIVNQNTNEPIVSFKSGDMTISDRKLTLDLYRNAPITLSRIKATIESAKLHSIEQYHQDSSNIEGDFYVPELKASILQNEIEIAGDIDRNDFPLSFIDSVDFQQPGRSLTISFVKDFDMKNVTYVISRINMLMIVIPTTEYLQEKKHIVLSKLRNDNRYKIIGQVPYDDLTIGQILALDFSDITARAIDDELKEAAKERDDTYRIETPRYFGDDEPPPLLNN